MHRNFGKFQTPCFEPRLWVSLNQTVLDHGLSLFFGDQMVPQVVSSGDEADDQQQQDESKDQDHEQRRSLSARNTALSKAWDRLRHRGLESYGSYKNKGKYLSISHESWFSWRMKRNNTVSYCGTNRIWLERSE